MIPATAPYRLHAVPAPQQRALGALQQAVPVVWQRQSAHLQGPEELRVRTIVDHDDNLKNAIIIIELIMILRNTIFYFEILLFYFFTTSPGSLAASHSSTHLDTADETQQ